MVVAHPDDESLWGAGLLLRYPIGWDVVCMTAPERDPGRSECFLRACEVLGANPVHIMQPENRRIYFNRVDFGKYDLIVTHNRDGEYGHRQHKEVHEFFAAEYPEKSGFFGYWQKRAASGNFIIELTNDESKKKMAALQCYDTVASNGRPTWTLLMETFAGRYRMDLWREPYEF